MTPLHLEANQLVAVFQIYFNKLVLSYLFQRYEQALENACRAKQYLTYSYRTATYFTLFLLRCSDSASNLSNG
jgi:predicted ATPase